MNPKRIALSLLPILAFLLTSCGLDHPATGTGYEIHKGKWPFSSDRVYFAYDAINLITNELNVQLIPEADASTFQVFEQLGWAKDAKHVFYAGKMMPEIDAVTFEVFDPSTYAHDSQLVYFNGVVIPNSRPDSFEILRLSDYARDSQQVYLKGVALVGAQPASFEIIDPDGITGGMYARDREHVYFNGSLLANAQPASFEILSDGYARDQQHIYFNGPGLGSTQVSTVLANAQLDSFEIINSGGDQYSRSYARDKQQVYFNGMVIANARPASFEILNRDPIQYTRDEQQVYYEGKLLVSAQPDSFEIVKDAYELARDSQNYFLSEHLVKTCHIQSFTVDSVQNGTWDYGSIWGHDKNCYYVRDASFPIADPQTFHVLGTGSSSFGWSGSRYAKDSVQVYWSDTVLMGADQESFQVIDFELAQDKNNCYKDGKVTDPAACKK